MRVALLSLACLIVACGGSEVQAVSETGRLVVEKSLADRPVFIERVAQRWGAHRA